MAKKKPKMKVNMLQLKHLAKSSLVREETLHGELHWVLPTVLITEGVFNGALYTANELAMFPESWDGRPILNQHPNSPSGNPLSANSPGVLEAQGIGQLFNTEFVTNGLAKLRSESWINQKRCKEVAPEIVEMIENGEDFEVSTGLFVEQEAEDGDFEGTDYEYILHNYRPDHLAYLPGGEGACNWQDGAGAPRLNKKEDNEKKIKRFRTLAKKMGIKENELSHEEVRAALHSELRAKFGDDDGFGVYITDVFDDFVIFERNDNNGFTIMKQSYKTTGTDQVELEGDPIQVVKQITYISVPVTATNKKKGDDKDDSKTVKKQNKSSSKTSNKKENTMDEKERKKRIDALISNERSVWDETDREHLAAMEDDRFETVENAVKEADEAAVAKENADAEAKKKKEDEKKEAEAKAKENEQGKEQKPQTLEEYVKNAPPEVASVLSDAISRQNKQQEALIKELIANTRNTFTEDELKEKKLEELQKIASLCGGVEDYSLQSNELIENKDEDAPEPMPPINWNEAAKKNGVPASV